jgi:hypothetical protein
MCAIPLVLVLCLVSDAFAEIPRDPNLVIYFPYEEVGTVVADESGKGHDGAVCGDISACPSGIKWYGAAQFQGKRGPTGYSYLDLNGPGFPAQDIPRSAITLAVWVKCLNTGDHHATLNARTLPPDNTWIIHAEVRSGGNYRWLLRTYGGTNIFDMQTGTVHWDEWTHYTGTYDKATGKAVLYINGEIIQQQNVTNPPEIASNWGAGARVGYNIDNARAFTGVMDEFYLYTRALSQPEIRALMVSDGLPTEQASHPWPANGSELDSTGTDLMWLPGATAVSSNVYFGRRFEDVNNGTGDTFKGNVTEAKFTVSGLAWGATYFWRIDSVNPADPNSPWKGKVWSFLLRPQTAWNPNPSDGAKWVDPNAVLSWSAGRGAVTHSVYFGDKFDDVNNATGGTPQAQTTFDPPGALGFEKVYYWRVDEFDGTTTRKGSVWSFTTRRADSGLKGQYYSDTELKTLVLTRVDPGINFNWGADSPDPKVPAKGFSARWTGEFEVPFTSDWTFTTNCKDGVRLWVNDQLLFDEWTEQSGVEWNRTLSLAAGQKYSIVMEYWENTDEARAILYWNSPYWLSPYQPKQVIPQGAFSLPLRARSPKPANGALDVRDTIVLSWTKGDTADKHDVYFGTDQAAVENATAATAVIYRGRQALDATTYAPPEAPLQWGRIYYWRIDEVEAGGTTIHKGNIWSFTVGQFFVVDDFESYNDIDPPNPASNRIFDKWIDGYATPTTNGAIVGNSLPPYAVRTNVHGGEQAMPMMYENAFKYSEATLALTGAARDWTRKGVVNLSLWFRGATTNAAEKMYVVLNGTAVVYNNDTTLTQKTGWTEWVIPLQQFASLGVNLSNVTSFTIGLGTRGNKTVAGGSGQMYFDDIRLYALPQVPVENFSFELPGTSKQKGFDSVPGWHTDGPCADSGVETGWTPTDGSWTAYLMSGDPSVWQLTNHVIAAADVLRLKVDARITGAAPALRVALYYDNNGARVRAASQDMTLSNAMREYSLSFSASAVPASVGHKIGIEFSNIGTGDTWLGLDNVRLEILTQ